MLVFCCCFLCSTDFKVIVFTNDSPPHIIAACRQSYLINVKVSEFCATVCSFRIIFKAHWKQ